MTEDETTVLIGFINAIDPRIVFDEIVVSAWKNVVPPTITLDQAMGYVRDHYRETDKSIFPANIVARHREATTPKINPPEAIDHECFDGWVLVQEKWPDGRIHEAATRCEICSKGSTS